MLVEQNSTQCYGIHPWKRILKIPFSFGNRHIERLASELIIGSRSREQRSILDRWNVPSNACNFIPVGTSVKRTRYYLPKGTQCFINNVALTPNRDANDAWCMHIAHVDSPSVKLTLSTAGNQCPLTRKRSSKTKPFVCPWTKGAPIGRRQREKRWRMKPACTSAPTMIPGSLFFTLCPPKGKRESRGRIDDSSSVRSLYAYTCFVLWSKLVSNSSCVPLRWTWKWSSLNGNSI